MIWNPHFFTALAVFLIYIGIVGLAGRKNLFVIYLSLELMLNGINLAFVTLSRARPDMDPAVIALLMVGVIAAEAAIFLAMIVHLFGLKRSVNSDDFRELADGRSR